MVDLAEFRGRRKGKKTGDNITTVIGLNQGQLLATVPTGITLRANINKGSKLKWEYDNNKNVIVVKVL